MTNREFLGEDCWKAWTQEFENLRRQAKTFPRVPDEFDRILIEMNRSWCSFYRAVL